MSTARIRLRRAADIAGQLARTANVFPGMPWGPWDRNHPVYNLIAMSGPRHWAALADLLAALAADGASLEDARRVSQTLTDLIIVDELISEPLNQPAELAELRRAVIAGCGGGAMLYDRATDLVDRLIAAAQRPA